MDIFLLKPILSEENKLATVLMARSGRSHEVHGHA